MALMSNWEMNLIVKEWEGMGLECWGLSEYHGSTQGKGSMGFILSEALILITDHNKLIIIDFLS